MVASEVKLRNFREDVNEFIKRENSDDSALRMANSIFSELEDFMDDAVFDLNNPKEMRDIIFDFYELKSQDYSAIRHQHLNPVKKFLTFTAGEVEGELRRNVLMVRDTLKAEYFQEEDFRDQVDKLDDKILSGRQKEILENKASGEARFAVELMLQTSAKIGALSAIKNEDFLPNKKRVKLRRQANQNGERPLPDHRKRDIEVTEGLITIYKESIKSKDNYLFGNTAKESYINLRELIKSVNSEVSFRVTPRILRDTSGYYKMENKPAEKVMADMGLKTDLKARRYQKVREIRRN